MITLVALTKYPDIWQAFHKNISEYVPNGVRKIVVVDGDLVTPDLAPGWELLHGAENFSHAKNYNIGMRAADPGSDILTLNDDIYFLEPNPVDQLQSLAYSHPRIGCVSARCKIGSMGNPLQCFPHQDRALTFVRTCTNASAYYRHDMIREVGYFDESFCEKYSAEDIDYAWRINLAGWRVAIARDVPVKHGYGDSTATSTADRCIPDRIAEAIRGTDRFRRKHGHLDVLGEMIWE